MESRKRKHACGAPHIPGKLFHPIPLPREYQELSSEQLAKREQNPFLRLPADVRNMIYSQLNNRERHALACTSRNLYDEVLSLYPIRHLDAKAKDHPAIWKRLAHVDEDSTCTLTMVGWVEVSNSLFLQPHRWLTNLILNNVHLTTLDQLAHGFHLIQKLDVKNNPIDHFDKGLAGLPRLEELVILDPREDIREFRRTIPRIEMTPQLAKSLRKLSIRTAWVNHMIEDINLLTNLTHLHVGVTSYPDFYFARNLKNLISLSIFSDASPVLFSFNFLPSSVRKLQVKLNPDEHNIHPVDASCTKDLEKFIFASAKLPNGDPMLTICNYNPMNTTILDSPDHVAKKTKKTK